MINGSRSVFIWVYDGNGLIASGTACIDTQQAPGQKSGIGIFMGYVNYN